jgi:hypothetical protein
MKAGGERSTPIAEFSDYVRKRKEIVDKNQFSLDRL